MATVKVIAAMLDDGAVREHLPHRRSVPDPWSRAALAFSMAMIAALTAGLLVYAALRAGEVRFGAHVDPAEILVTGPSGYAWRCLVATFAAGALAFPAHVLARRAPHRFARALAILVPLAAVALGAQASLAP